MGEKKGRRLCWIVGGFLFFLLLMCGFWMRYTVEYVEPERVKSENVETKNAETESVEVDEIEVVGEVCNIYDIVGDCDIKEIVSAEVYINGGTADGQSYVVEKEVAPNLLQALMDVVFKEEEVYQEAAIAYEDEYYGYSLKYEFTSGEIMTFYMIHADMIKYNGVVYKSHEEIEAEVVHYGITEGFSRGNAVKDIE